MTEANPPSYPHPDSMPPRGQTPDPSDDPNGQAGQATTVANLGEAEMLAILKRDCCYVLEQLFPVLCQGVAITTGSESSKITMACTYNPGGENSEARFDVKGKLSVPALGADHKVAIESGQLRMFPE